MKQFLSALRYAHTMKVQHERAERAKEVDGQVFRTVFYCLIALLLLLLIDYSAGAFGLYETWSAIIFRLIADLLGIIVSAVVCVAKACKLRSKRTRR